MPTIPALYLTDEEYEEVRKLCKALECSTYAFQKGCISLGLKNFDQIKVEVKKIKPKNRGFKHVKRGGEKEDKGRRPDELDKLFE